MLVFTASIPDHWYIRIKIQAKPIYFLRMMFLLLSYWGFDCLKLYDDDERCSDLPNLKRNGSESPATLRLRNLGELPVLVGRRGELGEGELGIRGGACERRGVWVS